MKTALVALLALVLAAAGSWYFLYPPNAMKRETERALSDFAKIVSTKDRLQITGALQMFLADPSKIQLQVNFATLSAGSNRLIMQDFEKPAFIGFIDNILYTLTDYGFEPDLTQFTLAEDKQSAQIAFHSASWAVGKSFYGGLGVNMNYNADTTCEGRAVFTGSTPKLSEAICKITLRMAPTPDEMNKFKDPEMLRKLLEK